MTFKEKFREVLKENNLNNMIGDFWFGEEHSSSNMLQHWFAEYIPCRLCPFQRTTCLCNGLSDCLYDMEEMLSEEYDSNPMHEEIIDYAVDVLRK